MSLADLNTYQNQVILYGGSQGGCIIGPQGVQGVQGTQGFIGNLGNQGFQGNIGVIGNQGWQGWQGYQGEFGIQGTSGLQGLQGDAGLQGSQGPGIGFLDSYNTVSVSFTSGVGTFTHGLSPYIPSVVLVSNANTTLGNEAVGVQSYNTSTCTVRLSSASTGTRSIGFLALL